CTPHLCRQHVGGKAQRSVSATLGGGGNHSLSPAEGKNSPSTRPAMCRVTRHKPTVPTSSGYGIKTSHVLEHDQLSNRAWHPCLPELTIVARSSWPTGGSSAGVPRPSASRRASRIMSSSPSRTI